MWVDVPALLSPLAREDPTEIPALLQPMCTSQTPRQHGQRTASRRDRRGEPQSPRRDQDQQHPQSSHKTPRPACCCKFTDWTLWPGLWGEGSAGEREAASRVGQERPRRGEAALLSSHREGESRAAWPWRHGRPEVACLENPRDGGAWWAAVHGVVTERLHFHFSLSCIGEGNGNPLQCSCLENPRDSRAWWAAVYGVAQSQT